ncbi:MAG: hypothetical protein QGH23_01585, partial [Dehalococcoidia bacterium]|nr:hypothetical protein [Dehalococcoidia bacterium]
WWGGMVSIPISDGGVFLGQWGQVVGADWREPWQPPDQRGLDRVQSAMQSRQCWLGLELSNPFIILHDGMFG